MKTIAIIGAGYSGLSLAMNIARLTTTPLNIILFDQSNQFGEGPAYRTRCLSHLLNVPAGKMSAFPDLPDDFVNWCQQQPDLSAFVREGVSVHDEFMPRAWYSRYLKHRFDVAQDESLIQFECIGEAVTAVHPQQQGWQLNSADGSSWEANDVVLAIGNSEPHQSGPLAGCDHKNIIKNPGSTMISIKLSPQTAS